LPGLGRSRLYIDMWDCAGPFRDVRRDRYGSIFQNYARLRRSDRATGLKVEAVIGASEVGIAPGSELWQHEEAGVAARWSRPRPCENSSATGTIAYLDDGEADEPIHRG